MTIYRSVDNIPPIRPLQGHINSALILFHQNNLTWLIRKVLVPLWTRSYASHSSCLCIQSDLVFVPQVDDSRSSACWQLRRNNDRTLTSHSFKHCLLTRSSLKFRIWYTLFRKQLRISYTQGQLSMFLRGTATTFQNDALWIKTLKLQIRRVCLCIKLRRWVIFHKSI